MFDNYKASGYNWQQLFTRESLREPPVSLGEEQDFYDPYDFDHSDESNNNCPRRIGTLEMRMQIDEDIADAAGLSAKGKGKQKERQVPLISCNNHLLNTLQCTRGSTSAQVKKEPLGSDVDYKRALLALVNVLNKIEFHSQSCKKCKCQINDHKAWILDSGASQHFTSTKQDFIDFEVVTNALEVKTAAANAVLRVEGKGAILLSHFVENRGIRTKKLTCIYPVLYIPGLSVKLLSMGVFLHDKQEVHGNAKHITFHDVLTLKPQLSAYLQNPWDTIFWVDSLEIDTASIASIYVVNYDVWHKHLGHPSKDVLKRAKELKDFPRDLVLPEHSPLCRDCAEGKLHSKSFPESPSRTIKPFELMHSDLKEFPIEFYSKFKYLVSFIDDHSSHAWVALLRKKSETLTAFKHFVAMVQNQYKVVIGTLMSDFGGEYKSREFEKFLKEMEYNLETAYHTCTNKMVVQNASTELLWIKRKLCA